ncbi:MAG: hypothetical protein AB3N28_04720 [Kordiimonas sp.]
MEDIFTYELRDFLMFSPTTYYRMIETYNDEISLGVVLPSLLLISALTWRDFRNQSWPLFVLFGCVFCWVAWQFFFVRFQEIMWASVYLGSAFFAQGVALFWLAQIDASRDEKKREYSNSRWLNYSPGLLLMFPSLGYFGFGVPEFFGITPDPTIYMTLAVLCLMRLPVWLYIIPVVWAGFSWLLVLVMEQPDAWLWPALTALTLIFFTGLSRRSTSA